MQTVKLVLIGDTNTGKTCLLVNYTKHVFSDESIPTVFDTYRATVCIQKKPIELVIYDTAGANDFERLRKICYKNVHVFLCCFSVDSRESFENIENVWLKEIKDAVNSPTIMLVGMKSDLRQTTTISGDSVVKLVTDEEIRVLMERNKITLYNECSSLSSSGVKNVFDTALTHVVKVEKSHSLFRSVFFCCRGAN